MKIGNVISSELLVRATTPKALSRPSTPEAQHEYNEVEAEALREEASVPDADGNTAAGAEGRQDRLATTPKASGKSDAPHQAHLPSSRLRLF